MRPEPEMLHRLPRILRSPQQQRITPRGRPERQLIERQALPARLFDPRPRRGGEVQRRDGEVLGHREQTGIIGDGADDDDGLVGRGHLFARAAGGEHGEAGEGERGPVRAGHEEPAEDDFVEVRVGSACWVALGLGNGGLFGVRVLCGRFVRLGMLRGRIR